VAEAAKSFTPTVASEPYAGPVLLQWRLLPVWRPTAVSVTFLMVAHSGEARFAGASSQLVKMRRFGPPPELFDDVKSRPGLSPVYDHAAIIAVAEEAIRDPRGVDDRLDWFVERVRNMLKERHIKAPQDTLLTELCAPIYKAAQK
jgi:hypothetical protein